MSALQRRIAVNSNVGRSSPAGDKTNEEIYDRIYSAVLEHRLPPGTKLGEGKLGEIFNVSRARVREVLARLSHERIVDLLPQRGAFVAKPTIEDAADVFEARRLIEPAVLRRLISRLTPEKLAALTEHQALEDAARQQDDKRAIVRLSGEFHSLLAELAGNASFSGSMHELTLLSSLMIFLYDAPTATSCRADEHSHILEAIRNGDCETAERLMLQHLDHIQAGMRLDESTREVDLATAFFPK